MRFGLPSWLTWYKKPEYRDIKEYSTAVGAGRRSFSPDRNRTCVPSRLKLDRVLANKTCSPMSLYDFYMYLKYIEFSAENLEFYIWFKNYEKAWAKIGGIEFDSVKSKSDSSGSDTSSLDSAAKPEIEEKQIDVSEFSCDPEVARETLSRITALISTDTACSIGASKKCAPGFIPQPPAAAKKGAKWTTSASNLHLSGDSIPGPRAELNAIVDSFLLPGAPKELNIPPAMRAAALAALQHSSDPVHLKPVSDHVYQLLRNCSHRNFVRLGVSNGTFETVCVATSLGIVLSVVGFLVMLLRAFVPFRGAHSQFEAFAPWPFWWLGMSLVLSGLRGSCFFLLLFSRRQPLPWERFDDSASMQSSASVLKKTVGRLMIFDRKVRVNDVHLRQLQRKIVIQSLVGGAIFASLGTLLFIWLPVWRQTM